MKSGISDQFGFWEIYIFMFCVSRSEWRYRAKDWLCNKQNAICSFYEYY